MTSDGVPYPRKPPATCVSKNSVGTAPHGVGQHVEVLLGGVEHGLSVRLEQAPQHGHVDRQRVDQDELVVPAELHQRQRREVGALPMELGVDRICRLGHEGVDDVVEIVLTIDPAVRSFERRGGGHAAPDTYSRPDMSHAKVPPATLTTSMP